MEAEDGGGSRKKADCRGDIKKEPIVDKFGFSEVDGIKYLDGTSPSDFDENWQFIEGKRSDLSNKYFSVRWGFLRGRSKKDGALYSSPSVFLLKDWQGKPISFTLPDKHVSPLRQFLQEVEKEKESSLVL